MIWSRYSSDRHLGAEPGVDRAELEADDPGADHRQPLRDAVERQRAGRGDDDLLVDLDAPERRRLGAGGDDDRLRPVALVADLDLAGAGRSPPQPFSQSTLFFLNRNSMPRVLQSTVDCL